MSQRTSFLVVGSAIGCSVMLFCLCIAAFAGYTYLSPTTGGTVDRIAYVDNSDNIQIVDARGENRVALTTDASTTLPRAYLFPTWSPNSQRVAFVGVDGESNAREATLYSAPAASGKPAAVFRSTTQTPFYLYWSPDSQWIGFLAQSETEMALMLGSLDGRTAARTIETGSPFYWAWSPDSRTLLSHVGGSAHTSSQARLALLPRDGAESSQRLKSSPAEFQAPHYSPDGSAMLFAATNGSADDALFLADARGESARSIATYRGSIAFAWSPDGKKIASLVTPEDAGLPFFGPVWISDADGSNRTQLTDEDALAFYWSPDSRQIAYLAVTLQSDSTSSRRNEKQASTASSARDAVVMPGCIPCGDSRALTAPLPQGQDPLRLRWRLVNLADKSTRTLAAFVPTGDFLSLLPYFDQYARSLTFWSPDSQHFVYTQIEENGAGSVWVADVAAGSKPHRVGDGTIAVWSWR